jgi:hypothetical protein
VVGLIIEEKLVMGYAIARFTSQDNDEEIDLALQPAAKGIRTSSGGWEW